MGELTQDAQFCLEQMDTERLLPMEYELVERILHRNDELVNKIIIHAPAQPDCSSISAATPKRRLIHEGGW
jgi:hypothetical protein